LFACRHRKETDRVGCALLLQVANLRECRIASSASKVKAFTLLPITWRLSCCLKLTSFTVLSFDGVKTKITGGRLNMGMWSTMEIFNGQGRRIDDSAHRSASNECVRLIRKLRWIGMDDEAERLLAQLSGWPFRPTETVIAGPWATD
jgi:hypothetical protein